MNDVNFTFTDVSSISHEISELVYMHDISFIDACLMYCEQHSLDEEMLGKIIKINQSILSEITKEAENLHFLQKQQRLQFSS